MKILIVSEMSTPYAVGGGETRYGLLSNALVQRGHDVTWLSMRQGLSPDSENIDGVKHLHRGPRIASPDKRTVLSMLRFMLAAFVHIISHRYNVVDVQTYAPLPSAWLACLLSKKSMVATIHATIHESFVKRNGKSSTSHFGFLVALAEAILYRIPYKKIIAVSRSTGEALCSGWGVNKTRIFIVPNGIRPVPVMNNTERDIDLVFAGRFVSIKNIDHLLKITAICFQAGMVHKAIFIGDGHFLQTVVFDYLCASRNTHFLTNCCRR